MPIIYEPKSRAKEYSELAANLYTGCSHGCKYCYVPRMRPWRHKKNPRQTFHSDPCPRKDIIKLFERDAKKMESDPRRILLSFTTDPYQPIEKEFRITGQALRIAAKYNLRPQILTKAGLWAVMADRNMLRISQSVWAATLTTDSLDESKLWEPDAAFPNDRIAALEYAHSIGLKTWVSFEPVINPGAVVRLIHKTHKFVDLYKVGKLNYHPLAKTIDWHDFLIRVEAVLDKYDKPRYIKTGLEAYRK